MVKGNEVGRWLGFVVAWALPMSATAEFSYSINGSGVTITAYDGSGGAVAIPPLITNLPVTGIANNAFNSLYGNGELITSLSMPNTVTNIGIDGFEDCTRLTSVTFSTHLVTLGLSAFEGCSSLTAITIPNSVTSIVQDAFASCSNLSAVTLGTNVGTVGPNAFEYCSSLTDITLPDSLTNLGFGAFYFCTNLAAINVGAQNPVLSSESGVLFDKNKATLLQYPGGRAGNYTIPGTVTSILNSALWNALRLTTVNIPATVTNFGNTPFVGCTSLTNISVDAQNQIYGSLGGVLFDKSRATLLSFPGGLTGSYKIPRSVTNIGGLAFGYANLNSLTIPASVTSISDFAFEFCSGLTNVLFAGNTPLVGSFIFYFDTNTTVYILPGTAGWDSFAGPPTVLWNPIFETAIASLRVSNGAFDFTIIGNTGIPIEIDVCTNLSNQTWTPLTNGTLTNGSLSFSDTSLVEPQRFYGVTFP
jgi:hypothetical protein